MIPSFQSHSQPALLLTLPSVLECLHKALSLADCIASGGSICMLDSQVEVHEVDVEVTDDDRNGDLNLLNLS